MAKQFTEAELLRLAQQVQDAEAQGYTFRRHWLCGRHKHRWRVVAWLCKTVYELML